MSALRTHTRCQHYGHTQDVSTTDTHKMSALRTHTQDVSTTDTHTRCQHYGHTQDVSTSEHTQDVSTTDTHKMSALRTHTRCQHYEHTRSYCNKPYACVKCGRPHNSADCTKSRDTPTKCAMCGGNHPANYKYCEYYHSILRGTNPHRTPPFSSSALPTPTYSQTAHPYNLPQQHHQHQQPRQQQQCSYVDVTNNSAQLAEEPTTTLKTFLDEFKGLFAQLVQQNSMILSMLSTLLNKYH